jgi:endonuclease G
VGEYVSIVQHPSGAPKVVAIRENRVNDVFDEFIHYATDTEPGSSGSPVFNDGWKLVALHHAGVPDPNDSTRYVANEGIRISSIANFLKAQRASLNAEHQSLVDELLSGASNAPPVGPAIPPAPAEEPSEEWYANSTGYDAAFLGADRRVPLPALRPDLEQDVAAPQGGGRSLDYTHFSVVMSKSRRLAFYTAVNIDGSQRKAINRNADQWYFDPRLDRKYQSGPELYESKETTRFAGGFFTFESAFWSTGKDREC